jgi:2-oxoglutarate dehydrogenase E2 component (dihydrolipoamide succinyltransferase)
MAIDIVVPTLGESVSDATIARWMKQAGEAIAQDEPIVELETDKVTLEVPSPVAGTLSEIIADEGATVEVGALLARVEEGGAPAVAAPKDAAPAASKAATPAPQRLSPFLLAGSTRCPPLFVALSRKMALIPVKSGERG